MSRRQNRNGRLGFTLIEVLVAASLVATVAISVFAAVQLVVVQKDSIDRATEPTRTADLVFEVIRQDFENAQPPRGIYAAAFVGSHYLLDNRGEDHSADEVQMFTTAPGADHVSGDGDYRRVEYKALVVGDEKLLVRRVTHNLARNTDVPPYEEEVLCRGVDGFKLLYYNGTDPVGGSNPANYWDSSQQDNALPMAVEVTLTLERPAGPSAPGQVVNHVFVRTIRVPCGVPQATNVSGLRGGFGR